MLLYESNLWEKILGLSKHLMLHFFYFKIHTGSMRKTFLPISTLTKLFHLNYGTNNIKSTKTFLVSYTSSTGNLFLNNYWEVEKASNHDNVWWFLFLWFKPFSTTGRSRSAPRSTAFVNTWDRIAYYLFIIRYETMWFNLGWGCTDCVYLFVYIIKAKKMICDMVSEH